MSWSERTELYGKIEKHRGHPLITYVTSKRLGAPHFMATDALPRLIEQINALPKDAETVDLLIVSFGGDPMVAWRLISVLRQRVKRVTVLIPQSAYSAATLVALGADEIVMHPNGHLGPVDMQITTPGSDSTAPKWFSTEDISAFLDFVRDSLRITDQEHVRALFEVTCKEVGSLGIGFSARSSKLAVDLGERLLGLHMTDDESKVKLRTIVENMSRKFQSHAYPVSRTEALAIGLSVNEKRDPQLEELMWAAWLNLEEELKEGEPFDAVCELLRSTEAQKLLSPVPQIDIPMFATASGHYQTTIDDVIKKTQVKVDPVDFSITGVIVDSSRLGYALVTKGKILSCRTPDLRIQYNVLTSSRKWERLERPTPTKGKTS